MAGTPTRPCRTALAITASEWSSHRTSASAWNSIDSTTSDQARSEALRGIAASAFVRVSDCRCASVEERWIWMMSAIATPGRVAAIASFIASSSLVACRCTGVMSQDRTSADPASVSVYRTRPSASLPLRSTRPSRSRRSSVE